MKFSCKALGFKELDRALAELPKATARNVLQRAALKGLAPMEDEAKRLAPRSDINVRRHLPDEIEVSKKAKKRGRKTAAVEAFMGPTMNAGEAAMMEFGTKPHVIKPKKKKTLKFTDDGQFTSTGIVHHPGAPPQPYMRPAFENFGPKTIDDVADSLRAEIASAAARARRKALRAKG